MALLRKSTSPAPSGKLSKTAAYYAAFVGLGLTAASLGPTLQGLADQTRTQISQASILFTAVNLGYLLGALRGGRLYDHRPGHRIQVLALLVMLGMMALVPVVPVLWLLSAALVVLGFAEGTLDVGGNTLLVWVHGEKVGPLMNGLHFFYGVGAFLSPLVVAQAILVTGGIRWAYWLIALALIPILLYLTRLPSPASPAHEPDAPAAQPGGGLVILIAAFFFLSVGAETSFGGWIFTYARATHLATEVTAAYVTSAFWGAFTLSRALAIPISTRVHPRWILLANQVGCLASLAAVLVWPASPAALWAGACGVGLFSASIIPTLLTLAGRSIRISGQVTGRFFAGGSAGSMLIPWLIGQLVEPAGPRVVIEIIFAATAASLVIFAGLMLRFARAERPAGEARSPGGG